MAGAETASSRRGYLHIVVAVFFFATSAIFIVWAAPLSPFEITVGRLVSAAVLVWVLARLNHQPLWPRSSDWRLFVLIGLITALHFVCYIASLKFTTIAHTLAITYTAPIFVTLFSAWFLAESITPRKWLGVLVAVGGIAVLELGGQEAASLGPRMWLGDLLAVGAAVAYALYSVAGRSQRERYGLFTYAGTVYILAALWALPFAVASFTPAGYNPKSLLAVLAAGLLSLGIGHTLYNASLRRLHATTVNVIATQEVTGGVILGALLLGQVPPPHEMAGVLIALAGIVMVLI